MQNKTTWLLIVALLLFFNSNHAQECSSCRQLPKVIHYDFDVQVPSSATDQKALFSLAAYSRNFLFEASRGCIRLLHPIAAVDFKNPSHQQSGPWLPTDAACNASDFLITGTVKKNGDEYLLRIELLTSCTRRILFSSEQEFHASSDTSYLRSVAEEAAARLSPLQSKIFEDEQKQRMQDKDYAFWSYGGSAFTIEPTKTNLAPNEETEVELTLRDCDGKPLANRSVTFNSENIDGEIVEGTTGGTVSPSQITTDQNGKAKVKFKMGKDKSAVIRPHSRYKKPSGKKSVLKGAQKIPKPLKVVSIDIMYEKDEETDVDPSGFMGPIIQGELQRTLVNQDYYASIDHVATDLSKGYLVLAFPEHGQDHTLYWDEFGNYHYVEYRPPVYLNTEQSAIKVKEQLNADEEPIEQDDRPISPKRHASLLFFLGNDQEPMRFEMVLNFENESDMAEGSSLRGAASVNINPTTPGAKFTMRKITDKKGHVHTEYTIEYLNKDLGSMDEYNKLADQTHSKHLDRLRGGIYYTGEEILYVRIVAD